MSTPTQLRKPQFKRKNAFFTALAVVGLPLSLALLFVGGVGMTALTDTEGKTALAQGVVGATARAIVKWNYLTIAMVFNGGLFGLVAAMAYLTELRAEQAAGGSKLSQKQTKKQQ